MASLGPPARTTIPRRSITGIGKGECNHRLRLHQPLPHDHAAPRYRLDTDKFKSNETDELPLKPLRNPNCLPHNLTCNMPTNLREDETVTADALSHATCASSTRPLQATRTAPTYQQVTLDLLGYRPTATTRVRTR